MNQTAAIIEMDEDRDRKLFVALDLKVCGANRELAQAILDHPRYPAAVVAEWIGCSERRVQRLRVWASEGFIGSPYDKSNRHRNPTSTSNRALKSNDNSIPTEEEAEESYQETIFEQVFMFLAEMTDETRQRFFAKLKREYGHGA